MKRKRAWWIAGGFAFLLLLFGILIVANKPRPEILLREVRLVVSDYGLTDTDGPFWGDQKGHLWPDYKSSTYGTYNMIGFDEDAIKEIIERFDNACVGSRRVDTVIGRGGWVWTPASSRDLYLSVSLLKDRGEGEFSLQVVMLEEYERRPLDWLRSLWPR